MKTNFYKAFVFVIFGVFFLAACGGEDFTPVYFAPPDAADQVAKPATSVGQRKCTVNFTSKLCVVLKGDNIEAGLKEGSELCGEVPPFPIHIEGATARIMGNEFPDIDFEGGGLPAPIVLNARGDSDGASNEGKGSADSSGNISVDGFSFYIVALGIVGEVPNLTLTTGSTEELPNLPAISGSAPDSSGAMTLVVGTVLGSVIPAADKYLMGASMQATFTGSISPSLSQCGGGEETAAVEIKKLEVGSDGRQKEIAIPAGNIMEVSSGTYIAQSSSDIGPRFEAESKFSIKNVSSQTQTLNIPPKKGAFNISSVKPLSGSLKPGETIVVNVSFRPTIANAAKAGKISESISLGSAQATLSATALEKSGEGEIGVVDDEGKLTLPDIDGLAIGEQSLPANTQKEFFLCKEISCGESKGLTNCKACLDPTKEPCELLPVTTDKAPIGEVDSTCKLIDPEPTPLYTIDLKGSSAIQISAKKQVLAIRNSGTDPLDITEIVVEDVEGSKSRGEFSIPKGAVFIASTFESIRDEAEKALAGGKTQGSTFPLTLPSFETGYDETTLYVVVTYEPSDLSGFNGDKAGVGSSAKDKAILRVKTAKGEITAEVTGTTTIAQSPALELYFKTPVGTRRVNENQSFPFRGVTAETTDLAMPLFLRAGDTAQNSLRVVSISVSGEDAANFQWLDTKEKIDAVKPESGKGLRCSIPIFDEAKNQTTDEIFDLKPVSISPSGFDLAAGAYSPETMPLFGCVNFHREKGAAAKRIFKATLTVTSQELTATGNPAKNPDGSYRETKLPIELQAAINPMSGKLIFRVTQTMAGVMNPKFPGLSAIDAKRDIESDLASGVASIEDLQVFTGAVILDPFDETNITTSDGKEIVSSANDGVTAVFRSMDTHPVSTNYVEELLYDFSSLSFDSTRPTGSKGIYEDYPNVPANAKANGWRIFTATLSYPGPLPPAGIPSPRQPSMCEIIDPCSTEGLKRFTKAGIPDGGKGACAFFYASGGRYDSSSFHTAEEMDGGSYENLCEQINEPQKLKDINTGSYSVDGRLYFEEVGLRFFGPTYFHNPGGPLGNYPPLDSVFHMGFTTGVLKPAATPEDAQVVPDQKINLSKSEFKINLDDPKLAVPPICKQNTGNRTVNGKKTSSWKFLKGLLYKDEDATIPAGCPESDNEYTGGSAYLRGRDLDHETGIATFVAVGKFGSSEDLSFTFKDVVLFVVLNGWFCNPEGSEDNFEGSKCYDLGFNDRDSVSQISMQD